MSGLIWMSFINLSSKLIRFQSFIETYFGCVERKKINVHLASLQRETDFFYQSAHALPHLPTHVLFYCFSYLPMPFSFFYPRTVSFSFFLYCFTLRNTKARLLFQHFIVVFHPFSLSVVLFSLNSTIPSHF